MLHMPIVIPICRLIPLPSSCILSQRLLWKNQCRVEVVECIRDVLNKNRAMYDSGGVLVAAARPVELELTNAMS